MVVPATPADLPAVRAMLEEYAAWIGQDLSFQGFATEVATLPGAYAPPRGALLVARADVGADKEVIGMVALRPFDATSAEMKRLFVRPAGRGTGIGAQLIDRIIDTARDAGYRRIVLDTLPIMSGAQRLYAARGFHDIAPYYASPIAGTRFMALEL